MSMLKHIEAARASTHDHSLDDALPPWEPFSDPATPAASAPPTPSGGWLWNKKFGKAKTEKHTDADMHDDGPSGPVRGTASELRERNAARAGISLALPEQPVNASAPPPEEGDVEKPEEPDLLDELAAMPTDQRLLAHDQCVSYACSTIVPP